MKEMFYLSEKKNPVSFTENCAKKAQSGLTKLNLEYLEFCFTLYIKMFVSHL